ncbi:MAG: helix-turn-helix domain-containing protein [Oscillospiraceae bacterium]
MFIDGYDKICKARGLSPTSVLRDLGISKGTYTNWKTSGADPLNPTKKKIADYFGITIDELESGRAGRAAGDAESDTELLEILESARRDPNKRILFSLGAKATSSDVKKYIEMIRLMCGDEDGASNY